MRKTSLLLLVLMMLTTMSACKRDIYGKLFVPRKSVTFQVTNEDGQMLSNVSLKTEELDAFDNDLIVNGTRYFDTDAEGKVTVDAPYYTTSHLSERTTRFTFTATDYVVFDTIFNYWEGNVDIVLYRE